MLEKYVYKNWLHHPIKTATILGFFVTIFSFIVSSFIFQNQPHLIGLTTIFFIVLLITPLFTRILFMAELLEKKTQSFFKKNRSVIDFHIYFFIGMFVSFVLINTLFPSVVFSISDFTGNYQEAVSFTETQFSTSDLWGQFLSILSNNVIIIFIFILLTIILGSGSLFIIVFNASMASDFISTFFTDSAVTSVCQASIFSIHFFPEMIGFLLAAISGGIFLSDVQKESSFRSFKLVGIDAAMLFILSLCTIVLAAFLETFVVMQLLHSSFCADFGLFSISLLGIFFVSITIFELFRYSLNHK